MRAHAHRDISQSVVNNILNVEQDKHTVREWLNYNRVMGYHTNIKYNFLKLFNDIRNSHDTC